MRNLITVVLMGLSLQVNAFESEVNYYFTGQSSLNYGDYVYVPDEVRGVTEASIFFDDLPLIASIVLDTQDNPIEEAWIEYTQNIDNTQDIYLSLGTADVLYGFYGNGLDILTQGSGVLPQGVYAYRFVKGGFSRIYGLGIEYSKLFISDALEFRAKYATGKSLIDSEHLHEESLLKEDSPLVDIENPTANIYSASLRYYDDIELFILHSEHLFTLNNIDNVGVVDLPTYLAATPEYQININRYGLRWMLPTFTEITYEAYDLDVINENPLVSGSQGKYLIIQQYQNKFVYKLGLSRAKNDTADVYTTDEFAGVSYVSNTFSIGIEHHIGWGKSWLTEGISDDWRATIITFGITL